MESRAHPEANQNSVSAKLLSRQSRQVYRRSGRKYDVSTDNHSAVTHRPWPWLGRLVYLLLFPRESERLIRSFVGSRNGWEGLLRLELHTPHYSSNVQHNDYV